jgi:hypothetical protein
MHMHITYAYAFAYHIAHIYIHRPASSSTQFAAEEVGPMHLVSALQVRMLYVGRLQTAHGTSQQSVWLAS